jgi:hypothetical protein
MAHVWMAPPPQESLSACSRHDTVPGMVNLHPTEPSEGRGAKVPNGASKSRSNFIG